MLNKQLRILLYGANMWYLADGMLGPLLAVFAERVGGSILDISWAWAIYLIVSGILIMAVGHISDKVSKQKLMVAGYALTAIFTFAYLLVRTPAQLFAVQAGLGVATALAAPTWNALFSHYQTNERRGFVWGLADGQAQLIIGIAMIAGGFIVSYLSFTILFVLMGTIHIIATIVQAQILWSD